MPTDRSLHLSEINRDDILQAISQLSGGSVDHEFADSTKFDLIYDLRRYPPKAVIGLAATRSHGRVLSPPDFSGGEDSQSVGVLISEGFDIVTKSNRLPDLDCHFSVGRNRDGLFLIIESRGPGRNPDYIPGMRALLERLAACGAVLSSANVESSDTRELSTDQTQIRLRALTYPVDLSHADIETVRNELGAGTAAVGRPPNARGGGNRTKRVRLAFSLQSDSSLTEIARILIAGDSDSPTWLFQGNPDRFDIDGYLMRCFGEENEILWSVTRYADEIKVGDTVFLWRAKGRSGAKPSGVIAHAVVVDPARVQPADMPEFYVAEGGEECPRVRLRLVDVRLDDAAEMIELERFSHDPILAGHLILRSRQATNYALTTAEAEAVFQLWSRNLPSEVEQNQAFREGGKRLVQHYRIERNKHLVQKAKAQFKAKHGRLFCEACGFDFEQSYGTIGRDFIEAHHNLPVSELKDGSETRIDDLSMLCSNCHRMIHRSQPYLMVHDLVNKLKQE